VNVGTVVRVANEADVKEKLPGGPAIFLSASVPYRRDHSSRMAGGARARLVALNQKYLDSAEPARIRSAVVAMTRTMLMHGMRLVFGAHPAISPMVLSAARDINAPKGSILIFQSEYFEKQLPDSTLELASWESGILVFTPVVRVAGKVKSEWRSPSLARMRELMVSVPNLSASIFIGGMEGVSQEAEVFHERNRRARMYAVASTGSAALELWHQDARAYSGTLTLPTLLAEIPSYSVVAAGILDDLGANGASYA
jgi:hypothetical protein